MTGTMTLTNKIGPHKPLVAGSNPAAPANLLRPSSHERWLPRSTQAYLHANCDKGIQLNQAVKVYYCPVKWKGSNPARLNSIYNGLSIEFF